MWSQAIVFFASFSEMSLASEEMSVINSTQHSMRTSRASLEKETPVEGGRISLTIFWTVAFGRERSSLASRRSVVGVKYMTCALALARRLAGTSEWSGAGRGARQAAVQARQRQGSLTSVLVVRHGG